ncbi:transporter substrate-binding domain-containing protein [Magnetococcales bacterium HHB-1]
MSNDRLGRVPFVKYALCTLILVVLCLLSAPVFADDQPESSKSLTILSSHYPPFTYLGPDGQPTGLSIDFWKLWSRKSGRPVQFELLPWTRVLEEVQKREHTAISGIFFTEERASFLDFTSPLWDESTHFFHRIGVKLTQVEEEQRDLRIGVAIKEHSTHLAKKALPKAQFISYPDYTSVTQSTINGEVDGFFAEQLIGQRLINQLGGHNLIIRNKNPISLNALRSAVRKGDKQLLDQINQGLSLISRVEVQQLFRRWSGSNQQEVHLLTANMPPIIYVEKGKPTGLGIEIVRELTTRLGQEVPITLKPWRVAYQETLDKL